MASLIPDKSFPLLELHNIRVDYGPVCALKQMTFSLAASDIHAIVGERGAGKSSLGMVISGRVKPSRGVIRFAGQEFRALSLNKAHRLGIEMLYQQATLNEIWLNPNFTVAENLGFQKDRLLFWDTKRQRRVAAQALLSKYQIMLDPATFVKDLTISEQILLDLIKRLERHPKLLILDDALGKLSTLARTKVHDLLVPLKQHGLAILVLTSRIDDIYDFADRVSVIKNGELVMTEAVGNIGKLNLIRLTYTQISREEHVEDFSQEFYQFLQYNEAILRNLPVNLIVADSQYRIKMVNESCKHHFRLDNTGYMNRPLETLFPHENENVRDLLQQAFVSKEETTAYQVPITVNQRPTINNLKTFPIYDGKLCIGYIITIEDITEYDQLQKQLIFSEKLASVGLLAAGVAHEINNPLEIIYNYLSYIKYNFHGKDLHEAINNVHEEIASIANIVSNLHTFSDNKKATDEELDVHEVIRSLLNLMKYSAKHKHINIHFTPSPGNLLIHANKNEIKQVILNLMKNSFEAMPSGGEIQIETNQISEHGQRFVQIRFTDTGPGINDANPNNIFLPFYSTKKGQGNNLGLGLSVSYGIIKKYNGAISVRNLDQTGCQFIITLPQSGETGTSETVPN